MLNGLTLQSAFAGHFSSSSMAYYTMNASGTIKVYVDNICVQEIAYSETMTGYSNQLPTAGGAYNSNDLGITNSVFSCKKWLKIEIENLKITLTDTNARANTEHYGLVTYTFLSNGNYIEIY